jgi:Xaa-Pro aminopeptidase
VLAKNFAERRQKVMQTIGKDSMVILPAAPEYKRNGDTDFSYRQNSDFYYLTGFKEPQAVVVLAPGRAEGDYILFNRERDPSAEVWVGVRAGQEGACKDFGAKQSFPIQSIDEKMPELLANCHRVYYPVGADVVFDQQMMTWVNQARAKVRSGVNAPSEFIHSGDILHEMRLRKDADEIALMRKAAQVSAQAHLKAMKVCRPGMMEYELQAELLAEFCRHGCYPAAYPCIVGAGANACVLHYVDNNSEMHDGDLVLIDAGGECDYYASDITRTFPVNGRFSPEQRAIYELVLQVQLAVIAKVKPGVLWPVLQETTIQVMTEGLLRLGILRGDLKQLIADKAYFQFYMHNIGHWLGLDTHDVGKYKIGSEWRKLEPGIVHTVEPGIYIRPDANVDKKWWNIGVRIEDDVLVTTNGCEILSHAVPKQIDEIEQLMRQSHQKVT